MSPVAKLLTRVVGLIISAVVMVASAFMLALLKGPGPYSGNKQEVNIAGGVFCISSLAGLLCFIGVVLSIVALGRAQDVSASRTSAPPR